MRYYHRTGVAPGAVLEEAERFFAGRLALVESGARSRVFRGAVGTVRVNVEAEGGHYTLVTVTTDQVGESEADKLAKRFLGSVHRLAEPGHVLRGAY